MLGFGRTSLTPGYKTQIYEKETPTQVIFSEYCEIFKNTYFEEHLRTLVLSFEIFWCEIL